MSRVREAALTAASALPFMHRPEDIIDAAKKFEAYIECGAGSAAGPTPHANERPASTEAAHTTIRRVGLGGEFEVAGAVAVELSVELPSHLFNDRGKLAHALAAQGITLKDWRL